MRREDMADLTMFLAVAEERSFTAAARKLGLSQSALSHSIRRLETRLGLRLLARTTRSIAPTEAGERLLEVLQPAIESVDERLTDLRAQNERLSGTIRITTTEHAAEAILWPVIDRLTADYPDIAVELSIDNGLVDIVQDRFDAGVRMGEMLSKDMIAVRIGPDLRMAAFAAPEYLAAHGIPQTPQDLARHRCITMRFTRETAPYAWEFSKDGHELRIRVEGQWIVNRLTLVARAALAGHGIGFLLEDSVLPLIREGRLVRVLEDWCEPFSGYHLYYPTRRQASPAFRLLVDALRYRA